MKTAHRTPVADLTKGWVSEFQDFLETRPTHDPSKELRSLALSHFQEQGMPHRKMEAWRNTPLTLLEEVGPFSTTSASKRPKSEISEWVEALEKPEGDWQRLVFIDGQIDPGLSTLSDAESEMEWMAFDAALAEGSQYAPIQERLGQLADLKTDALAALNTAYMQGGVYLRIPASCQNERPLHLLFVSTGSGSLRCPRNLVVAESGSQSSVLVEHTVMDEAHDLTNCVTELFLAENAQLQWTVLEHASESAIRFSDVHAYQARDSRLSLQLLTLGGRLVRNNVHVALADTGAEVDLNGLFLASTGQLVDHHTEINHAMPQGRSQQLHKSVLTGNARGVFRGMINVSPHAQKTNSSLSNPNLLLSDQARIETQPQLEIYADDVKCSHGSTVGQIDEEAIFYLQSRGIGRNHAKQILTRGFINEICDRIPNKNVQKLAYGLTSETLESFVNKEETI